MAVRLILIIFSTLGVVYMSGRLLFPKLKDRGKNIIAFFALIFFSFIITLVYDYKNLIIGTHTEYSFLKYLLDSILYSAFGAVFYVVIGWRFYSRVDYFLDRKFGKDDRRRQ